MGTNSQHSAVAITVASVDRSSVASAVIRSCQEKLLAIKVGGSEVHSLPHGKIMGYRGRWGSGPFPHKVGGSEVHFLLGKIIGYKGRWGCSPFLIGIYVVEHAAQIYCS